MAGGTKPKRRRRVWQEIDPMSVALNAATLLTQNERERLVGPLREAMDALRRGCCSQKGWIDLVTNGHVALCIEEQGIVRGLQEHLVASDRALVDIQARATAAGGWTPPTCYGHELSAVDTMIDLYAFQIGKLSAKEYRNAVALAKARHLSHRAKAGA